VNEKLFCIAVAQLCSLLAVKSVYASEHSNSVLSVFLSFAFTTQMSKSNTRWTIRSTKWRWWCAI